MFGLYSRNCLVLVFLTMALGAAGGFLGVEKFGVPCRQASWSKFMFVGQHAHAQMDLLFGSVKHQAWPDAVSLTVPSMHGWRSGELSVFVTDATQEGGTCCINVGL